MRQFEPHAAYATETTDPMNRAPLSPKELSVLEGVFWAHGPSRDALSTTIVSNSG